LSRIKLKIKPTQLPTWWRSCSSKSDDQSL